jgi:hypothetical protein
MVSTTFYLDEVTFVKEDILLRFTPRTFLAVVPAESLFIHFPVNELVYVRVLAVLPKSYFVTFVFSLINLPMLSLYLFINCYQIMQKYH